MTLINQNVYDKLHALGVSSLHHPPFGLPEDSIFEPPCSIKWMSAHYMLRLGAFSYAVSGYYFGAEIGRYVSIGESVQVGRGSHPVNWASTSPVFYQPYRAVTDLEWPDAESFRPTAPYIAPVRTLIGNDVYIGHGAFIMQGVTIGDGAVIGAGSVVTKDVPPYAVVAGSPAVVKKMRFEDALIEGFQRVAWWKYAFWALQDAPLNDPHRFVDFVDAKIARGLQPYNPKPVVLRDFMS